SAWLFQKSGAEARASIWASSSAGRAASKIAPEIRRAFDEVLITACEIVEGEGQRLSPWALGFGRWVEAGGKGAQRQKSTAESLFSVRERACGTQPRAPAASPPRRRTHTDHRFCHRWCVPRASGPLPGAPAARRAATARPRVRTDRRCR